MSSPLSFSIGAIDEDRTPIIRYGKDAHAGLPLNVVRKLSEHAFSMTKRSILTN